MDQGSLNERLSRISTLWTLIEQAHAGPQDAATSARRQLLQRYCGAVYRYLLGAVRDEDAALELSQEFFLRFVRGDFRRADPQRGRFRDYVKTALVHLVTDHHRARRERPGPLPPDYPEPARPADEGAEAQFLDSWREELLSRTWATLAENHPSLHTVLIFHVQHPDIPSSEMADRLTAQLGKPLTAGNVRVTLHRAREKFADLLVDEVAHSLEAPSEAELIQEMRDLHLLKLCAPALKRRGYRC